MNEEFIEPGITRDEQGRFIPGVSGNPAGQQPQTKEQKALRKAVKELIADYKEKLAEALPEISPVLVAKALAGDISAIKELHDRVMGKAPQSLGISGELNLPIRIIEVVKPDEPSSKSV